MQKEVSKEVSPFHSGEQKVQNRLGVRDRMERFGRQVIRDHMPSQHRDFYQQLPFVFVGHSDAEGWPWASILTGTPGFISSSAPKSLQIEAQAIQGDPLQESLRVGNKLGLLGIELASRRRNRLTTQVQAIGENLINLSIDQAFGNCPQYIQTRNLKFVPDAILPPAAPERFFEFDEEAKALISKSDTFFVASYLAQKDGLNNSGSDISHRGGKPGFVRIDKNSVLTIPDYLGNFHFNTLGNFIENPKAGLLFLDFERGNILTLTGSVEILWDSEEAMHFSGAERLWKFKLDHGYWIKNALPYRWNLDEYSPNTLLTGTWLEAKEKEQAERNRNQWLSFKIKNIVNESQSIKSFYLQAVGHQKLSFKAGQYLTLKAEINYKQTIRTYTVSSAPADALYRISVKKELSADPNSPNGIFSNFLHDDIQVGDSILAKAPCGNFHFDSTSERPAVLIAGGIGITPMISMARHVAQEGIRTRSIKPMTIITAFNNLRERAFNKELNETCSVSNGNISHYSAISNIDANMTLGNEYHHKGRINSAFLQTILGLGKELDQNDYYLCGPKGFMQSLYDMLLEMGVPDNRILAEQFGPASLERQNNSPTVESANEALIEFTLSGVKQVWTPADGSLLELAENHGLEPEFSCRRGKCGACKAKLISGKIVYTTKIDAYLEDNELLLCCAVPAPKSSALKIAI